MSVSAESIRFNNDAMWVGLSDGRTIGVSLAWFPRLMNATDAEQKDFTISPNGLHWANLDEDILIEELLVF